MESVSGNENDGMLSDRCVARGSGLEKDDFVATQLPERRRCSFWSTSSSLDLPVVGQEAPAEADFSDDDDRLELELSEYVGPRAIFIVICESMVRMEGREVLFRLIPRMTFASMTGKEDMSAGVRACASSEKTDSKDMGRRSRRNGRQ